MRTVNTILVCAATLCLSRLRNCYPHLPSRPL
jgi:hypothetical protein